MLLIPQLGCALGFLLINTPGGMKHDRARGRVRGRALGPPEGLLLLLLCVYGFYSVFRMSFIFSIEPLAGRLAEVV